MSRSDALRVGILTVSDGCHRGEREDVSGELAVSWSGERGYRVVRRAVVPDESAAIVPLLLDWCDDGEVDAVITTGGTGFGPRDVTPEATGAVVERRADGLAEAIRRAGEKHTPYAVISRGTAGIRGRTLVVNLPGSPGGVRDGLAVLERLIEHVVDLVRAGPAAHPPPPPGPGAAP